MPHLSLPRSGGSVKKHLLKSASLIILAGTLVSPASARDPAPIVFAGAKPQSPGGYVKLASAPTSSVRSVDRSGKRVEYRYPDQPDMVYGEYGPRRLLNSAPMVFSSSETAISVSNARRVSNVSNSAFDSSTCIATVKIANSLVFQCC